MYIFDSNSVILNLSMLAFLYYLTEREVFKYVKFTKPWIIQQRTKTS